MEGLQDHAYGMWLAVAFNVGIFLFFSLSYLKPVRKREWRSMGVFGAFLVALFTEMYGFPLTIYILSSVLGSRYPVLDPFTHINGHLWVALAGGSTLVWTIVMIISNGLMLLGLVIMGRTWKQIHSAAGSMVTSGLYQRTRHPQYFAIFLMTIGMLVQWPTIITVLMWPVLMLSYYYLARREEREMEEKFGEEYRSYKRQVPLFWPHLGLTPQTMTINSFGK